MTVQETLIVLCESFLEGLIRLGLGIGGIPYDPETTWSATFPNLFK
mgnify:FL=1